MSEWQKAHDKGLNTASPQRNANETPETYYSLGHGNAPMFKRGTVPSAGARAAAVGSPGSLLSSDHLLVGVQEDPASLDNRCILLTWTQRHNTISSIHPRERKQFLEAKTCLRTFAPTSVRHGPNAGGDKRPGRPTLCNVTWR